MDDIQKRYGVHVIYDVSSETRTAEFETRLGVWDSHYEYMVLGAKYGVDFVENGIESEGLVQYVHLQPWTVDGDGEPEVSESVIDNLLANGWSLADG